MFPEKVTLSNSTKGRLPRLPFVDMKEAILGKRYEISISFVTSDISQKLNKDYRGKDNPTNILSFALSKTSGELIIDPVCVKKDAPNFDMDFKNFLGFLVIHGMLHLKGYEHGSTMERYEKRFCKVFDFKEKISQRKK